MAGNQVRIGVGVKDNASKPIKGISDAFHRLQTQGGQGFAIGAGAAATAKAFSLLDSAASAAIGFLGDAATAYREDQVSVAQLGASLRSNVKDWDGNTRAIEDAITARMKLGFADEEQRAVLTRLVGAYGDVTKALEVERLAMDLARFSGMSLADASDVLIKVHAGSYRALKSLGISTKDVKTETQALGLIFQKVGGQASDYSNTDLGKVEAANLRLGEAQERLGKQLSEFGAIVLPAAADAVDGLGRTAANTGDELTFLRLVLEGNGDALAKFNARNDAATLALTHMADATKDDLTPALAGVVEPTDEAAAAIDDLRDKFLKTRAAANDLSDELKTLTGILFDQEIMAGDIAQAQKDLQDVIKEGPGSKAPGAWTIWTGKVEEARKRLFELQFQQKQTEGPAAMQAWLLKQRDALDKADVKARAYLNSLILANAALLALAASSNRVKDDIYVPPTRGGGGSTGGGGSGGIGGIPLAHGGPYSPNQPYLVGEKGPELIVPTSSGNVIPNNRLGSGVTVNLTVQGDLRARSKEDVVSALQRAAAFIR